jgi:hypothetical protein
MRSWMPRRPGLGPWPARLEAIADLDAGEPGDQPRRVLIVILMFSKYQNVVRPTASFD